MKSGNAFVAMLSRYLMNSSSMFAPCNVLDAFRSSQQEPGQRRMQPESWDSPLERLARMQRTTMHGPTDR